MNKIIEALREARLVEYKELAVLEMGERKGHTGYIDFLTQEDMPVGADVAQFRDKHGRQGIALQIRSIDGALIGVIAIFQRYVDGDRYCYGLREQPHLGYHQIHNAYNAAHDPTGDHGCMACPKCPPFQTGVLGGVDMAVDIIKGQDLCFRLANGQTHA